jgi:L-lactate dehydrogenase complex protein LldF
MSEHTVQFVSPIEFKARARTALADDALRSSFRGAMTFLQGKRAAQFPDADELEQLRDLGEAI